MIIVIFDLSIYLIEVHDNLVENSQAFHSFSVRIQFIIKLVEIANIREHDSNVWTSLGVEFLGNENQTQDESFLK